MDRLIPEAFTGLLPGIMFWAGRDPGETLAEFTALGIRHGQLGLPGDLALNGQAALWKEAAQQADFIIHTVFTAYEGESYADLASVQATVGFVPQNFRSAREARTHAAVDFAQELGTGIATHIGFIPHNSNDADYQAVLEMVRRVADHIATGNSSLTFALETGQETAPELLAFLKAADRPNLGINFDPANMILYGTGDPLDALATLAPHVLSAHLKDGTPPLAAGQLGTETPLGQGSVPIPEFLAKLQEIGYRKPVFIEREASDSAQRLHDIAAALKRWPFSPNV